MSYHTEDDLLRAFQQYLVLSYIRNHEIIFIVFGGNYYLVNLHAIVNDRKHHVIIDFVSV